MVFGFVEYMLMDCGLLILGMCFFDCRLDVGVCVCYSEGYLVVGGVMVL